VCSSRAV